MGFDPACNKKRISNIEQGMSNAEAIWQGIYFIIQHSLFDIRYSFQAHGAFEYLELAAAEEMDNHAAMMNLLRTLNVRRSVRYWQLIKVLTALKILLYHRILICRYVLFQWPAMGTCVLLA
jgi:hypothetical protein